MRAIQSASAMGRFSSAISRLAVGTRPRVGVYLRPGEAAPAVAVRRARASAAAADNLAAALNTSIHGICAYNGGYRYERAIGDKESDLVLAPNGAVGNALFRSMCYLGGGEMLGLAILGPERLFGNSSWANSLKWAARFTAAVCH